MNVQYGCALDAPQEWLNFDASPTLRLQKIPILGKFIIRRMKWVMFPDNVRYGDIVKGLPVSGNSCDLVYCSHILEHLSYEDLRTALANTFKILKPKGVFRLIVPDLESYIRQYVQDASDDASIKFLKETQLGQIKKRTFFGQLRYIWGSHHCWMWDFKALRKELAEAGFQNIRRMRGHDSQHAQFNEIEAEQRWKDSLVVECEK